MNGRTSINETTLPEGGKDGKPVYVPAQTLYGDVIDLKTMANPNPGLCSHPSLCIAGKTSGVPTVSVYGVTPIVPHSY